MSQPSSSGFFRDLSFSAVATGFIATLVTYASSVVIIFQGAQALGVTQQQTGSWLWALGMALGISSIALSLRYRMPILTTWSVPGAAMLAASASGLSLSDAMGAFMLCAALTVLFGYSGWFAKLMRHIPSSLTAAMLAGILLRFGLETFTALQARPVMVLAMLAVYLAGRIWFARYAVIAALLAGIVIAATQGLVRTEWLQWSLGTPAFVSPTFSLAAVVGVTLPLFVVTMASQNIPGVAIARASGYALPVSKAVGFMGLVNLILAPFGAFAISLAAITGAICMGPEAHEDSRRRYVATVTAGVFYILAGLMGGTMVALFSALPKELIMGITGIALIGIIAGSLSEAMAHQGEREPAVIAFLVTASGISLAGIGSAFWGLVAGTVVLLVLKNR